MVDQAEPEEVEGYDTTMLVYTGHTTTLYRKLEVPNPYYTSIQHILKSMGCLEQLRRGGGSAHSKWILLKEPDVESFVETDKLRDRPRGKVNTLEQQVRGLTKQVIEMEARLTQLEAKPQEKELEGAA